MNLGIESGKDLCCWSPSVHVNVVNIASRVVRPFVERKLAQVAETVEVSHGVHRKVEGARLYERIRECEMMLCFSFSESVPLLVLICVSSGQCYPVTGERPKHVGHLGRALEGWCGRVSCRKV